MKPQMNTDRHGYLIIGILALYALGLAYCVKAHDAQPTTQNIIIDFTKKTYQPYQQEYERMLYPTVRISTPTGIGSGVIFHRRDAEDAEDTIYILSASHVVGDQTTVTVELFYPKDIELEATVIITDTTKDLALIRTQITADFKDLYTAKLASSNYQPFIFTPVYTVGCSLGLEPRPSSGQICVIRGSYWEVSSPILPGNSGGPVFALVPSEDGNARTYEVIGIAIWVRTYNNQLITTMAGIVPIQEIYNFLDKFNSDSDETLKN